MSVPSRHRSRQREVSPPAGKPHSSDTVLHARATVGRPSTTPSPSRFQHGFNTHASIFSGCSQSMFPGAVSTFAHANGVFCSGAFFLLGLPVDFFLLFLFLERKQREEETSVPRPNPIRRIGLQGPLCGDSKQEKPPAGEAISVGRKTGTVRVGKPQGKSAGGASEEPPNRSRASPPGGPEERIFETR